MSTAQNTAFEQLLAGWRRHEELRSSGAAVGELSDSRRQLDQYRWVAAVAR